MNYIDVTQNKHTHCVRNNTVVITNREGIQGTPGRDGDTPYIGANGIHSIKVGLYLAEVLFTFLTEEIYNNGSICRNG